jgi:hypothetical protein
VEEKNRIKVAKEILTGINIRIYKRRTDIPELNR